MWEICGRLIGNLENDSKHRRLDLADEHRRAQDPTVSAKTPGVKLEWTASRELVGRRSGGVVVLLFNVAAIASLTSRQLHDCIVGEMGYWF